MRKSWIVAMLLLLSFNLLGQDDYGFLPPVEHHAGAQVRSSMCVSNPSTDIPWDRSRSFADQVNDAIDGENRRFGTSYGNYVHPNYDPSDPFDISAKVLAELRRVYGLSELEIEYDESLIDLATDHSCAMDLDDTFCHTCPSDGSFSSRVRSRIGDRCFQYISENIAWITIADVEASILRVIYLMMYADVQCCDNGHRDNFLNCDYGPNTKIGFGIIRGDLRASNGAFFDAWIMTWDYLTYWSYPDCGNCNCGVDIGTPLCDATSGVVLPIDLIEFETKSISCDRVAITWSTGSEINNDFFTLEKSTDGLSWTQVEVISGAGNSVNKIDYRIEDDVSDQKHATVYYRLRQTDFDGNFTLSDVSAVENDCRTTELTLQPNPTTSSVTIVSSVPVRKVDIYAITGKLISEKIPTQDQLINVEALRSGIYIMSVETEDGNRVSKRLVKQ